MKKLVISIFLLIFIEQRIFSQVSSKTPLPLIFYPERILINKDTLVIEDKNIQFIKIDGKIFFIKRNVNIEEINSIPSATIIQGNRVNPFGLYVPYGSTTIPNSTFKLSN